MFLPSYPAYSCQHLAFFISYCRLKSNLIRRETSIFLLSYPVCCCQHLASLNSYCRL